MRSYSGGGSTTVIAGQIRATDQNRLEENCKNFVTYRCKRWCQVAFFEALKLRDPGNRAEIHFPLIHDIE